MPKFFLCSHLGLGPGARALRTESSGREKDLSRDCAGFPQDEAGPAGDRPVPPTRDGSKVLPGGVTARSMKTGVPHSFSAQRPCARAVSRDGPPRVAPIQIRFEGLTFFKLPALPEVMTIRNPKGGEGDMQKQSRLRRDGSPLPASAGIGFEGMKMGRGFSGTARRSASPTANDACPGRGGWSYAGGYCGE